MNAQSIKYLAVIDLANEIDHRSPRNRVQLFDGRLEVFLVKKEHGVKWDSLEPAAGTFNRSELITRRQASIARFDAEEAQRAKLGEKTMHAMERDVVGEQMALDEHRRNQIDGKRGA